MKWNKRVGIFFHFVDKPILLSVIGLNLFGLLMIASASGSEAINSMALSVLPVIKQLIFVVLGLLSFILIAAKFEVNKLPKRIGLYAITISLLMIATLAFSATNGARAWIHLGPFTFQSAEFYKIFVILWMGYYYGLRKTRFKNHTLETFFPLIVLGISMVFIALIQNDLGTSLIVLFVFTGCFLGVMNRKLVRWQTLIVLVSTIGLLGFLVGGRYLGPTIEKFGIEEYKLSRITNLFDPLADPYGSGYQLSNGLIAFAEGGVFGKGLGNSTQKYGYIPEAHNDFIIAIVAEELGLIGVGFIMFCYAVIIFKILSYAQYAAGANRIILSGIASYFMAHLLVNIGGVSGLIPMTGVPLLFISYGGTAIWAAYVAIAIALVIIGGMRKNARLRISSTRVS